MLTKSKRNLCNQNELELLLIQKWLWYQQRIFSAIENRVSAKLMDVKEPGLWIRIHFLRIRIRIQSLMLETNTDPDTDPDPIQYGSRALMTKNF
jgi:hypothetical protein